ncbi:hypothetical protein Nepgr_026488 [Nepenthes gracilis]|uniref:Major facilitator superfamily (MFS) profile domain-containing protein n=1 Tax=Nepenthes gracilis TaxID=150966 RepID=A0AAD3Y233_NEPGR|nr:hypothetical protein Nepgr_026488 [Nepenthes gracilis]
MANTPKRDSASNPSWFTPKRLLLMFCIINMLNYVDRGAIASNGVNGSLATCTESGICTSASGIQGDFNLNNFQDGVLSSAFMVGLLLACPIFASLAKSHNPFRLIGVGLSVWTFATAGCGSSFDFWSIAICRMLVGVGEASFISLAAPFIDDNAPVAQKTAWLAMFYMCIPTGIALGYVYGGFVGYHFNWRYAFWGEAFMMLPFAVMGFVMKPLTLKGFAPPHTEEALILDTSSSLISGTRSSELDGNQGINDQVLAKTFKLKGILKTSSQLSKFYKDIKALLLEEVYVVNILGYISYNFVLGAYSYWGPKAGYNIYHMSNADLLFGGITIFCGILGTLSGGYILDSMNATISNAFRGMEDSTWIHESEMNSNYIDEAAAAALGVGDLSIETNMILISSPKQPQMAIAEDPMAKKHNYSGGGATAMAASSPTSTLSSPIFLNFGNAITPVAFVGDLNMFSDGPCPEWK